MFDTIKNKFGFMRKQLRTFSYLPAIGWREVPVEEVKHLFRDDITKMKRHDRASYRHTINGELVSLVVAFYGNENRKDVNYVKDILKNALRKHEEAMKTKGA
jgi:hypothetical protein